MKTKRRRRKKKKGQVCLCSATDIPPY